MDSDFKKFLPNNDQLQSCKIDLPSPSISLTISNAFQALINGDYDQSEKLSRICMDAIWERLNIGHWKDVQICWRRAYYSTAFCTALSLVLAKGGDDEAVLKNALRICDQGLLMGMPDTLERLTDLASQIHRILPSIDHDDSTDQEGPDTKKRRVDDMASKISPDRMIPKIDAPSLETFLIDYLNRREPCVIRGIVQHWPASQKWNLSHICRTAGYRTVPVEIGSKYTEDSWSQKLMTIKEYVGRFFGQDRTDIGYLAQHRLFDQIPELRNDIVIPDYCYCSSIGDDQAAVYENDVDINAWFGPSGTVSPLHYDPRDNILAQVLGRKLIRLYSPSVTESLYAHEGMLQNTSRVDVEKVDLTEFPKFPQAPYMECILEAGEMLFIPKKWWHYVRSLDVSFSVSFWFGNE